MLWLCPKSLMPECNDHQAKTKFGEMLVEELPEPGWNFKERGKWTTKV
jgi:hypothetical protein